MTRIHVTLISTSAKPTKVVQQLLDSASQREFKSNLAQVEQSMNGMTDKQQAKVKLELQSAIETMQQVGKIRITPQMSAALQNLLNSGLTDDITDEEAKRNAGISRLRKPSTSLAVIQKLPATVSKDMQAAGLNCPKWIEVKHLPGYLSSAIRAMGRQVFKPFTNTPIEDIQVVANFNGSSGPHTLKEVQAVASWLQLYGERVTDAELKFTEVMPGYEANLRIYAADGYEFMVVKDFAGYYIYAYVSSKPQAQKALTKQ